MSTYYYYHYYYDIVELSAERTLPFSLNTIHFIRIVYERHYYCLVCSVIFFIFFRICNFPTAACVCLRSVYRPFSTNLSRNASDTICKPDTREMRFNNIIISVQGYNCFPNLSLAVYRGAVYYRGRGRKWPRRKIFNVGKYIL